MNIPESLPETRVTTFDLEKLAEDAKRGETTPIITPEKFSILPPHLSYDEVAEVGDRIAIAIELQGGVQIHRDRSSEHPRRESYYDTVDRARAVGNRTVFSLGLTALSRQSEDLTTYRSAYDVLHSDHWRLKSQKDARVLRRPFMHNLRVNGF
jgi:hypothetical protein